MKTRGKILLASLGALPFVTLAPIAAHAAANNSNNTNTLIDRIATRFNLNSSDVKAVFEADREARQAERQTKVSDALKAAGFSDAQISALQEERTKQHDEMQTWRDANPNANREEMRAEADKQRQEFQDWASSQNIDLTKVHETLQNAGLDHGPFGMGRGMRGGEGM